MYIQNIKRLTSACIKCFNQRLRYIHMTSANELDQRWREARGLPMNPNASGVLTDSADYSFLDGRPVPYGTRQKNRIIRQKEITETIMKLSEEVNFAVERHKQMEINEEQRKQQILANKLKPKGLSLIKKK